MILPGQRCQPFLESRLLERKEIYAKRNVSCGLGPKSEVATTWIGLSEGGLYAYRVHLKTDGKGLAAFTKKNSECVTFSISSWTYKNGDIRIEGKPLQIGEITYSPLLTGKVAGSRMSLFDKGDDWKIRVELKRESEMLDLHARLQKAMAELEIRDETKE